MRVFAIGDLHLSLSTDKPMDIFGDHWKDHHIHLEANWKARISNDDLILLPGDLSWAMNLDEAAKDLKWLADLPGRKIILKGNHDYWWTSLSKMKSELPEGIIPLQNSAFDAGAFIVAGSRGWMSPESDEYSEEKDRAIRRRELIRLELSLDAAEGMRTEEKPLVVMMHYPPIISGKKTDFSRILSERGATFCIYGHLHCAAGTWNQQLDTAIDGVKYRLVSSDYLGFEPIELDIAKDSIE